MANTNVAANWALAKRAVHWGIALAIVVALIAPKPEHGEGTLHIAAGSAALALVIVRIVWRVIGGLKPYLRDALRLRLPNTTIGPRGFAPLLLQGARIAGFLVMAVVPVAVALGVIGIGQGEDSPLLELHESAGNTLMALAIIHAAAVILFSLIMKFNVLGITLTGGARSISEGGARGAVGLAMGVALAVASVAYIWGPLDIQGKAAAMREAEHGGRHGEEDDD